MIQLFFIGDSFEKFTDVIYFNLWCRLAIFIFVDDDGALILQLVVEVSFNEFQLIQLIVIGYFRNVSLGDVVHELDRFQIFLDEFIKGLNGLMLMHHR
jgi:hypothetical protein